MILPYTSCLFGTVVLHAYHKHYTGIHHAFLTLTLSSIMFHTTHCTIIQRIDKLIAHCVTALVLLDAQRVVDRKAGYLLVSPACGLILWNAQSFYPHRRVLLHAALHCVFVLGMHAYLWIM